MGKGVWEVLDGLQHPKPRVLAESLRSTVLHSKAVSTTNKYTTAVFSGGFREGPKGPGPPLFLRQRASSR